MSKAKQKLQYVQTPSVVKVIDAAKEMITNDGLTNIVAGLGGSADKRTHNRWSNKNDPFNDFSELEAAYRNSWLARQIVDIPANDATREWRSFNGDHADLIAKEEKRLKIQSNSNAWIKNARLYGGSLMLMVTGQDLAKPLNINAVKKGDLKKVLVFDRWYLSGTALNITNPLSDNFLQTEYYFLAGTGQAIHHSHVCRLNGAFLPLRLNQYEQGFGDSVLRKCLPDITDVSSTNANIANLVFSANVDTVKRKGLFAALASSEDQKIINRYSKLNLLKSTIGLTLLDEDETYERNQLSFSGLPQILQMQMQWASGSADIPMTRLFGSSPGGLNATGESDLTNYYDSVKSDQESMYREGLEKLDQVMLRSAGIENPDEIDFEWNPLYQDSNTEKATQRLAEAQVDQIYLANGVVTEAQIAKRLQSNGDYDIEDADIKELESLKDEENEALLFENEELRNKVASNEDELNAANERASKAVADASSTIIETNRHVQNVTDSFNKKIAEIEKAHSDEVIAVKDDYDRRLETVVTDIKAKSEENVSKLIAKHNDESKTIRRAVSDAISEIKSSTEDRIKSLINDAESKISVIEELCEAKVDPLIDKVNDAKLARDKKVSDAEVEHEIKIKHAKTEAENTINGSDLTDGDLRAFTDGINYTLSSIITQCDRELEHSKRFANKDADSIISKCNADISMVRNDRDQQIEAIRVELESNSRRINLDAEMTIDALKAKAYELDDE